MRQVKPWLVAFAAVALVAPGLSQKKPEAQKKDAMAEPTHWGAVVGRVYSMDLSKPIDGAVIKLYQDGKFEDKGRTVGKSDATGQYKVDGILGRVSQNLDVGRLLTTSVIGLLAGAATNTTKRIDVSRFVLRVEAQGYKPFEGVVTARLLDAKAFRANLEPIVLVPERAETISASVPTWGIVRISSLNVSPDVAKPGDKVSITAVVSLPPGTEDKSLEVVATSRLWKGAKKLRRDSKSVGRDISFLGDYTVGKKEKNRAEPITVVVTKTQYDVAVDQPASLRLLQVIAEPAASEDAIVRKEVVSALSLGDARNALEKLKTLASGRYATLFDCEYLGFLAERSSDYDTASKAQIQRMALLPDAEKPLALRDYCKSLLAAKQYSTLATEVESVFKVIPKKDHAKKIPAATYGSLGLSYIRLSRLDDAKKLNKTMAEMRDKPSFGYDATVIEFRSVLRIADVERAIAANPKDATAFADYGRALLDQGRYEEAIPKLQESLALDSSAYAVQRDLAYATFKLAGGSKATTPTEQTLAAAKAQVIPDPKKKSKDFFSWHAYSMLLLQAYLESNDDRRPALRNELIDALRDTIKVGRAGAVRDLGESYWWGANLWLTGSEVAIAGFAYPDAYHDFLIMESVKQLASNADDYWANYNLATALLDLNQPAHATKILQKLSAIRGDSPDTAFLGAVSAYQSGNIEQAIGGLRSAVKSNPVHPKANSLLAEALTKTGDPAGAAEALAAHARWYGSSLFRGQQ